MNNSETPIGRRTVLIYGLAVLFSLIGMLDAIYLTVQHLSGKSVKCTVTGGCSKVLSSSYATIAGLPTASFGAMAYFAVFSLATLALFGFRQARTWLILMVVPMILMTCWLFYLQAFVLHAFCEFCLLSASMTLLLTLLAFFGWRSQDATLPTSSKS